VRAATPNHPARRVVDARHAALYVPVRRSAWRGHPIVPRPATTWTGHADAFGDARDALRERGLAVDAWVVLTHAPATAEHAVWSAFGDVYRHALCPAAAPVRQYAATLVSEVLDLGRPDGLVLDACGPMGVTHRGAHEQTGGAGWSPVDELLLSLCFCSDCRALQRAAGLEPGGTAAVVRAAVGAGHPDLPSALGDLAGALLTVRHAATTRPARRGRDGGPRGGGAASRPARRPRPVGGGCGDPGHRRRHRHRHRRHVTAADVHIAAASDSTAASVARLEALRAAVGSASRFGARVSILPPAPPDPAVLSEHWRRLRDAGADELHLYHAGPASTDRLNAAACALQLLC
jgi:hypothetical protein